MHLHSFCEDGTVVGDLVHWRAGVLDVVYCFSTSFLLHLSGLVLVQEVLGR